MEEAPLKRRQLPKLYACATKASLENFRNKALYGLEVLDAKAIRRLQQPLHECLVQELRESGYIESATFFQNLIYDNIQLVNEDDLGIVVDLRKRKDYLEYICENLQKIEKEHDRGNLKKESLLFLRLAIYFADKEKGNLWLAEKLFLVAIAVASQVMTDGGRQKACSKYHYAKFLLDKFPGLDDEEPYNVLTDVRNNSIGKDWLLREEDESGPAQTVFSLTAVQLHRVLINLSRKFRTTDTAKAERLARLAERRAQDAQDISKEAEAIIEIGVAQLAMNNVKNAQKSLARALTLYIFIKNIDGICETKMHFATVMQKLDEHEEAEKLLTEMGLMAMEHGLQKHLGRALHLLGELHLMRERPELGTEYLREAFACFMGFRLRTPPVTPQINVSLSVQFERSADDGIHTLFKEEKKEIYIEEAERSRLMAAVCSGQEIMASYFSLLREAHECTLARVKTIEWKLNKVPWWVPKEDHNLQICLCPNHNRTPLDVLRIKQQMKKACSTESTEDEA